MDDHRPAGDHVRAIWRTAIIVIIALFIGGGLAHFGNIHWNVQIALGVTLMILSLISLIAKNLLHKHNFIWINCFALALCAAGAILVIW